jgi:hypothetical protein
VAAAVVAVLAAGTAIAGAQRGREWVVLGEREVSDAADRDLIEVGGDRGTFTAVRFDVLRHAVDFRRVVIHFRNGDDQEVELANSIPAGESSRVIDVAGANRIIRSIEFWYDAKTIRRGVTATVRAMGRR